MKKKRKKNRIIIDLPTMNRHTLGEVYCILQSIIRSDEKLNGDQIQHNYEAYYHRQKSPWKSEADTDTEPF